MILTGVLKHRYFGVMWTCSIEVTVLLLQMFVYCSCVLVYYIYWVLSSKSKEHESTFCDSDQFWKFLPFLILKYDIFTSNINETSNYVTQRVFILFSWNCIKYYFPSHHFVSLCDVIFYFLFNYLPFAGGNLSLV